MTSYYIREDSARAVSEAIVIVTIVGGEIRIIFQVDEMVKFLPGGNCLLDLFIEGVEGSDVGGFDLDDAVMKDLDGGYGYSNRAAAFPDTDHGDPAVHEAERRRKIFENGIV